MHRDGVPFKFQLPYAGSSMLKLKAVQEGFELKSVHHASVKEQCKKCSSLYSPLERMGISYRNTGLPLRKQKHVADFQPSDCFITLLLLFNRKTWKMWSLFTRT